jgi:pimeloyl-ACP methyl ester carboxylesterase
MGRARGRRNFCLKTLNPIQKNLCANGVNLAVYEYVGQVTPQQPPVIFFHASSFHGRCWNQVITHLPDWQCWSVDARNHGHSAKTDVHNPWPKMGHDAVDLLRQLGLHGAIGVGHSLGGNQLVRVAAAMPQAFSALLLIDPVIFSPDWYHLNDYDANTHFTMQRRNQWRSPDEMFERFNRRKPFINWQPAVLHDYCQYGLLPAPNAEAGFVLACSPEAEANVYASSRLRQNSDIYTHIANIQQPVHILRCTHIATSINDLDASPTTPDLASHFAHGHDIPLPPSYSHFIPMEDPALIAQQVKVLRGSEK